MVCKPPTPTIRNGIEICARSRRKRLRLIAAIEMTAPFFGWLRQRLQMPDRATGCDGLCRRNDRVGVDTVVPVELGERAGLAEMLDAERARAVAADGP